LETPRKTPERKQTQQKPEGLLTQALSNHSKNFAPSTHAQQLRERWN
jgi:hypothetical protein